MKKYKTVKPSYYQAKSRNNKSPYQLPFTRCDWHTHYICACYTVVSIRCTCACEHLIPFKADLIRMMSVVMKNRACNLQSRRLLKASRWKRFQTKERQKLENGAEGQWRGRKRGDRRGERSFRVAMKTTEALQEFGNQWTLLYPPTSPLLIPLSINVREASQCDSDAFPMRFNMQPINPPAECPVLILFCALWNLCEKQNNILQKTETI